MLVISVILLRFEPCKSCLTKPHPLALGCGAWLLLIADDADVIASKTESAQSLHARCIIDFSKDRLHDADGGRKRK